MWRRERRWFKRPGATHGRRQKCYSCCPRRSSVLRGKRPSNRCSSARVSHRSVPHYKAEAPKSQASKRDPPCIFRSLRPIGGYATPRSGRTDTAPAGTPPPC
eukprot:2630548-Prymnesium_polylepis.1